MEKIAVISVYYGKLPPYYKLWLRSCELNSTIDFIFVTDIELDWLPDNVHQINMSFSNFHNLIENKLGLDIRLDTPSCLKNFATGSVNGALWTIFTELQLYIILGIVYNWIKKFDTKKWMVLLGGLAICNVLADFVSNNSGGAVAKIIERFFLTYALWFFIGVFCYIKREKMVPLLKKLIIPLLFIYVIYRFLPIDIPGYYSNIVVGVILPLIVIGGGYSLPAIRIPCDLTYEIFLYHWIVLNIIIHFDLINKLSWGVSLTILVIVTFILAGLSWRLVGKGRKAKR